jgi:hypothetical protein
MRRISFALFALLAIQPAFAKGVNMAMDEVRTVTFPKPVATVYVGNPAIADVNMIDTRHAFILGKGFGNTNLVALDHDGGQVSDMAISVLVRRGSTVTLQRGGARVTLNCSANYCETTPEPGDVKTVFEDTAAETNTHTALAKTAASAPVQ